MSEFFRYALDKKLAPMWAPFGVRPSTDGVTLTDDGALRRDLRLLPHRDADDQHRRRAYHHRLPVVDGGRCPPVVRRRRAHVRHQRGGRSVRALPREGREPVATRGSLGVDGHGRGPRRTDACALRVTSVTRRPPPRAADRRRSCEHLGFVAQEQAYRALPVRAWRVLPQHRLQRGARVARHFAG